MFDVAVIGAGVVGGMIAHALARYELKICMLEKNHDVAMGASSSNSGIVHAGFDAVPGSLKAKLNVRGSEMMEKITGSLGVPYRNNGSLVVAFSQEEEEELKKLCQRGLENGVKKLKLLRKEELTKLEPNIGNGALSALYAPTGAIVSPYELTIAAIGNAMDNGAELYRNFKVENIICTNEDYEIVSGKQSVKAKFVINAAGLYADQIAYMIGDRSFSLHSRKGEYLLLDKECGGLVNATIFGAPGPMGKGILVSPTTDGNLLLGPTSEEEENKSDKTTTATGLEQILKGASKRVEGIPVQKRITSFCGRRAVGTTGDFIINVPKKGFINVAGIESPGLSASPAIAEYVVELLREEGLSLTEKQDYIAIRKSSHAFRNAKIEEKNQIIQKDSRYEELFADVKESQKGKLLKQFIKTPVHGI